MTEISEPTSVPDDADDNSALWQPTSVLLSVEEAAAALRIGRTKVYELLKEGDLRSVTIGRRRLIPVREVQRFADDLLSSIQAA